MICRFVPLAYRPWIWGLLTSLWTLGFAAFALPGLVSSFVQGSKRTASSREARRCRLADSLSPRPCLDDSPSTCL